MDLRWGFWQVPIRETDKCKTAFITSDGLYEYNKMPFGLKNSPPTFQHMIDAVLAGLRYSFCLVYVDDIIVFSHTFKEHMDHVSHVLDRPQIAGLRAKSSKCKFAVPSLKYLGHVVSGDGIKVDIHKIDKLQDWPLPTTVKQLQSFLGFANYYRAFVPQISQICQPLYQLAKKGAVWDWTPRCATAFHAVVESLVNTVMLHHYEDGRPLIVSCDASKYGLGAVLEMVQENGNRVPLMFASRLLNLAEQNYSNTEREGLAVVWAIENFSSFLWNLEFTVETDHSALIQLRLKGGLNGRWAR